MANRPKAAPVKFETFGGEQIVWEDLEGALLAISPTSIERGINTVHGTRDAVVAHVLVIDGEHAGDQYQDAMVFPAGLFGQLKNRLNRKMLGRLGKGNVKIDQETGEVAINPETGEAYNAAWKFLAATAEDTDIATAFVTARRPKAV